LNNQRIGIDLDNTIICYENAFATAASQLKLFSYTWSGQKNDLKKALLSRPEGQRLWQMVQGRVYGTGIADAELFPGVERFLRRCKYLGKEVFIVSHKTEFGHFDSSGVSLREAALSWLEDKQFFGLTFELDRNHVFFADTRSDKVARIAELKLDVFIDDLQEVLEEPLFPEIKKVLFGDTTNSFAGGTICGSWHEIEEKVLGTAGEQEIALWFSDTCGLDVNQVNPVQGGGNNRVFRVVSDQKDEYALKLYPDLSVDPRTRLRAEVLACSLTQNLDVTPVVCAHDSCLNLAVFNWIDGARPRVDQDSIQQAVEFVTRLREMHLSGDESTPLASEACLSIREIFDQVDKRISVLKNNPHPALTRALGDAISPLRGRLEEWVGDQWSMDRQTVEVPLSSQTLSPSDFGFHNAVEKRDGTLCFIDLEYFGRDDPVKLIADFLWHPGMDLNVTQKKFWLHKMFQVFGEDTELTDRFFLAWPVFGLRWALILLNEFREDGWKKRLDASHRNSAELADRKEEQLAKALGICEMIKEYDFQCPYV